MNKVEPNAKFLSRSDAGFDLVTVFTLTYNRFFMASSQKVSTQKINFDNGGKSIVYFASDAVSTDRISAYGGYNPTPNIEFLASQGVKFNQMVSASAATMMCHLAEWSGLYPYQHGRKVYNNDMGDTKKFDSIFKVYQRRGYNIGIKRFLTEYRKKHFHPDYFGEMREVYVDSKFYYDEFNVIDLIQRVFDCIEESQKEGKPYFIFCKFHGMSEYPIRYDITKRSGKAPAWPGNGGGGITGEPDVPPRKDYPHFDEVNGIQIPTISDMKLIEEDYCIGEFIRKFKWTPDKCSLYYGSDHGFGLGQRGKLYYGYDLYENITHIAGIYAFSSDPALKNVSVNIPTSQTQVFDILQGKEIEFSSDKLILSESCYYHQKHLFRNRPLL
jgi:hypothetical protein